MYKWEENIRKVTPYTPGAQPKEEDIIKLNTNENPYPPSPKIENILKNLEIDTLRLYPDPTSDSLIQALAERYGVKKENLFVGVGSDDVLAIAFLTFFNSPYPILFPDITYSFYEVWAELFDIPYKRPKLDEKFRIYKEDYYEKNGGIVLANPNAPTGIYEKKQLIKDILTHNSDAIVIIDEAYIDFGGDSMMDLIPEYPNLLIVQTFSKSRSMAGVRIGFAVGNTRLIEAMNAVKYSYNSYTMSRLALALGAESVKDDGYFKQTIQRIIEVREWTKRELSNIGFSFPDSMTNFLFVTHSFLSALELYEALKKAKIYVRYFHKPRIDNYLRITIGTKEQMEQIILFLKSYIEKRKKGKIITKK